MTKGSKGSGNYASKTVATTGYASSVPVKTTVSFKGSGGEKGSYQNKSQYSYGDKQTGSYGRGTTTEKASVGDFHWKNGTTGTRSEYTQSSTFRFGDKRGYTEVRNEQSFRDVTYNKSNSGSHITYGDGDDDEDGGSDGGYDDEDGGSDGGYDDDDDDGGSYYGSESDDGGSDGGYDSDGGGTDGGCDSDDGGTDGGYDSEY
ncbi:hypothetical protein Hdeb2414_s0020g00554631 [Helianthus debilis subsp. tardiflorus]